MHDPNQIRRMTMRVALGVLVLAAALGTGCGRSEEDLMVAGDRCAAHERWGDAISAYRAALEKNPAGAHAPEALYKIGMIQYSRMQDLTGALQQFDDVVTRFPASAEAPKALMVQGFLYAEEPTMRNLDKARQCYEHLVRDYPEHELARGARFELEHLGQTAGQVLGEQSGSDHPVIPGDSLHRAPSARALAH